MSSRSLRESSPTFGRADRNHRQIRVDRQLLQVLRRKTFPHIGECGQAQVRLVDAIQPDGLVVIHARKRGFDGVPRRGECRGQKSFDHFPDALRLRIGHFQIDLGEFRLAVGAQVFVAETAHDLKIFVEAGDHQDLLEHLRRLRQGIKRPGLHAAGHQIVARAFRRGARHERGFNLEKSLRRQIIPDRLRHLVPQLDVELHHVAAQIDVAIFQPRLFIGERGVGRQEWRQLRLVQNPQLFRHQFHFAGRDILVYRAWRRAASLCRLRQSRTRCAEPRPFCGPPRRARH